LPEHAPIEDSQSLIQPLARIEERLGVPVFDSLKPELLKVAVFMNHFTIGICFGDFERYGFVTNGTWQAWSLLLEDARKTRQEDIVIHEAVIISRSEFVGVRPPSIE
jgi:hypothetical protein